jgi:chromosome segregation ATPase
VILAPLAVEATPLIDPGLTVLATTFITVVIGGVMAILLKRARGPAERLAEQTRSDTAAAERTRAEAERDAMKEAGYREAAEFVKQSASTSIATYREQTIELSKTITLLTTSLESNQRLLDAQRNLTAAERRGYEETIAALRARIVALEGQLANLQELTRHQRIKLDLLEQATAAVDESEFSTIPPAELDALRAAMTLGTDTQETPTS